jgi:hypothetical protein
MKTIEFYLAEAIIDLMKEAEGVGFQGYVCPIWAEINDGELKLSLGAPVSKGTTFIDQSGQTCSSWVGNIECWQFEPSDEDKETLGEIDDFERDNLIDVAVYEYIDRFMDNFGEEIRREISDFCKENGYKVEFTD